MAQSVLTLNPEISTFLVSSLSRNSILTTLPFSTHLSIDLTPISGRICPHIAHPTSLCLHFPSFALQLSTQPRSFTARLSIHPPTTTISFFCHGTFISQLASQPAKSQQCQIRPGLNPGDCISDTQRLLQDRHTLSQFQRAASQHCIFLEPYFAPLLCCRWQMDMRPSQVHSSNPLPTLDSFLITLPYLSLFPLSFPPLSPSHQKSKKPKHKNYLLRNPLLVQVNLKKNGLNPNYAKRKTTALFSPNNSLTKSALVHQNVKHLPFIH